MRYIISDIHGCYEQYQKLLEKINFTGIAGHDESTERYFYFGESRFYHVFDNEKDVGRDYGRKLFRSFDGR